MKPLKWGVVSTAKIGLEKVLPAMAESPNCEIVAIASRDLERAESAARKLGIATAYGSYEDLFADARYETVNLPAGFRDIEAVVPHMTLLLRANIKLAVEAQLYRNGSGRNRGLFNVSFAF